MIDYYLNQKKFSLIGCEETPDLPIQKKHSHGGVIVIRPSLAYHTREVVYHREVKVDESQLLIKQITSKRAIRAMKKIHLEIKTGKRKTYSKEEFLAKYVD